MRTKLPAATRALLDAIVELAEEQGSPIYLVGGFVRDLLLKRPNLDLDLVLEGDAIQLGRALAKQFGGRLLAHKAFGTAVWWLPKDHARLLRRLRAKKTGRLPEFFDLISARREIYRYPAALPTIQFADIREDLYRRDFTINTLALRLGGADAGSILDPWGGVQDLRAGLLRTLHPGSFSDDPTRALRILRLAGRLNFRVEKDTRAQLKKNLPILKDVSGERIRTELELALLERERVSILGSMQKSGVLRTIHPRLRFTNGAGRALARMEKPTPAYWRLDAVSRADLGFVLWLMYLPPAEIADIDSRLNFRADLRKSIQSAAELRSRAAKLRAMPASKIVELIEGAPDLAVYAVYLAERNADAAKRLQLYASKWRHIQPLTDGNRLRKLGLEPGPVYKLILGKLRAARLDGKIRTAKQEQKMLEGLLKEHR